MAIYLAVPSIICPQFSSSRVIEAADFQVNRRHECETKPRDAFMQNTSYSREGRRDQARHKHGVRRQQPGPAHKYEGIAASEQSMPPSPVVHQRTLPLLDCTQPSGLAVKVRCCLCASKKIAQCLGQKWQSSKWPIIILVRTMLSIGNFPTDLEGRPGAARVHQRHHRQAESFRKLEEPKGCPVPGRARHPYVELCGARETR